MKELVFVLMAITVGAQAVQPRSGQVRNTSLAELKETLEKIRANLLSMRPTMDVAAGLVDTYTAPKEDSLQSVQQAFTQLSEKNIPSDCLQEATVKLNEIKAAVNPNCTAVRVVEDVGDITYNTIHFTAVSMVTLDEVLNGLQQCSPWYKLWHYLPCVFEYAWSSYKDLSQIITAAVETWNSNEAAVKNIAYQVVCKSSQLSTSHLTTNQVLNEAYLCSKKSFQGQD